MQTKGYYVRIGRLESTRTTADTGSQACPSNDTSGRFRKEYRSMTTLIATRQGILAEDKITGTRGGGPNTMEKVVRLGDGSLLSFAGTCSQFAMLYTGLEQTLAGETVTSEMKVDELQAVRVLPDGSILFYDHCSVPFECTDDVVFLGSGADLARAAVFCGRDLPGAMEVAGQLDPSSSPRYNWYPLEEVTDVEE